MAPKASVRVAMLLAGLTFFSCVDRNLGPLYTEGWAVYLLADPALTSAQVREIPPGDLLLASSPLIEMKDVESYDWDTHVIRFTPEMEAILDTFALRRGTTQGVPFVVTVDGERIYEGTFWWGYSSTIPWCPYIELFSAERRIDLPPLHEGPDPRSDPRIHRSFFAAGKLTFDSFPL